MKIQRRRRMHDDHLTYHYDILLIAETQAESRELDCLGDQVGEDGLIATGKFELRLADGYGEHYIALVSA